MPAVQLQLAVSVPVAPTGGQTGVDMTLVKSVHDDVQCHEAGCGREVPIALSLR
jgi:hypothetical protein